MIKSACEIVCVNVCKIVFTDEYDVHLSAYDCVCVSAQVVSVQVTRERETERAIGCVCKMGE